MWHRVGSVFWYGWDLGQLDEVTVDQELWLEERYFEEKIWEVGKTVNNITLIEYGHFSEPSYGLGMVLAKSDDFDASVVDVTQFIELHLIPALSIFGQPKFYTAGTYS